MFEVQAYLAIVVGGLLAFNVIYPSDEPSIARLMGMWSLWMFTVPSLRARDCDAKEKDALNLLFVAMPLVNVLIPFVWKSFAGVFSADVLLMAVVYAQKGVFAGRGTSSATNRRRRRSRKSRFVHAPLSNFNSHTQIIRTHK